MARPPKEEFPPASPHLTPEYWRNMCGDSSPSARDRFLYLTVDEFGRRGPGGFKHTEVSQSLGYTSAMINHYFGSRDGLIAEGSYTAYLIYVEDLRQAVADAPRDPRARLRAWMMAQIQFGQKWPGWAVAHNYPRVALGNPLDYSDRFRELMTVKFELNLGRLAQLILDVQSEKVSEIEITEETFDRARYLANSALVDLTASVAMSTLGSAVWFAGKHEPSQATPEAVALSAHVVSNHIENVIDFVYSRRG